MTIDKKFSITLVARSIAVENFSTQVRDYLRKAINLVAAKTAQRAADRTPKSALTPHIADGWTAKDESGVYKIKARVFNRDPRARKKLPLASGGELNYTLLDVLEYGSSPHTITAVNAPMLVFFWKKAGRWVQTPKVNHPGTRPYAMMAIASVQANTDMKKVADAVTAATGLVLSGGRPKFPGLGYGP